MSFTTRTVTGSPDWSSTEEQSTAALPAAPVLSLPAAPALPSSDADARLPACAKSSLAGASDPAPLHAANRATPAITPTQSRRFILPRQSKLRASSPRSKTGESRGAWHSLAHGSATRRGPPDRIRFGLQLAARNSAPLARRCEPSAVQLAVRRDRPLGREGSNPSKAKRPVVLRAGRSFYDSAERAGFEPALRFLLGPLSKRVPSATRSPLQALRGRSAKVAAGWRASRETSPNAAVRGQIGLAPGKCWEPLGVYWPVCGRQGFLHEEQGLVGVSLALGLGLLRDPHGRSLRDARRGAHFPVRLRSQRYLGARLR